MGPALAPGGKLTLERCVWYPGPGLMEKACFHSCQSHLLRATPRLHTHGKDHHLSISHNPLPQPGTETVCFCYPLDQFGRKLWAKNINNTRWCVFHCLTTMRLSIICVGPCECLEYDGFCCELDLLHILWWFIRVKKMYDLWHIGLKLQLQT